MAEVQASNQPLEQDLEFTEYTLDSGDKYRVGRPLGSGAAKEKKDAAPDGEDVGVHGPKFTLGVSWKAGSAGNTDSGFASRTGIDKWNIQIGGAFYKYRISFHTTQTYDFFFTDESNDTYECNVWVEGWHYIDYNSELPNMRRVRGT